MSQATYTVIRTVSRTPLVPREGRGVSASFVSRSAGQAEEALGDDVAHDVGGAAHDRVGRCVADGPGGVAGQERVGGEDPSDEVRHPGLVFGAEALGGGAEAVRGLGERLAVDEQAAEP